MLGEIKESDVSKKSIINKILYYISFYYSRIESIESIVFSTMLDPRFKNESFNFIDES